MRRKPAPGAVGRDRALRARLSAKHRDAAEGMRAMERDDPDTARALGVARIVSFHRGQARRLDAGEPIIGAASTFGLPGGGSYLLEPTGELVAVSRRHRGARVFWVRPDGSRVGGA